MSPDQLPSDARIKFVSIEQAAADASALMHATLDRLKVTEGKALMAQQVLDTKPSAPRQQQMLNELASAKSEMQQLRTQQDQRMQRHGNAVQVLTRLKNFLRDLPDHTVLESVAAITLRVRDEALTTTIQSLRNDIAQAQQELLRVQAAPLPLGDIKAKVDDYVQELVRRGSPTINIERGQFTASWWGWSPGQPAHVGPMHLLQVAAWLDPAKFTERLLASVQELPTPKLALSASDKQARTNELTSTIEQLERQEESLIEQALACGQDVLRRPQANPCAILGVTIAQRTAVAA